MASRSATHRTQEPSAGSSRGSTGIRRGQTAARPDALRPRTATPPRRRTGLPRRLSIHGPGTFYSAASLPDRPSDTPRPLPAIFVDRGDQLTQVPAAPARLVRRFRDEPLPPAAFTRRRREDVACSPAAFRIWVRQLCSEVWARSPLVARRGHLVPAQRPRRPHVTRAVRIQTRASRLESSLIGFLRTEMAVDIVGLRMRQTCLNRNDSGLSGCQAQDLLILCDTETDSRLNLGFVLRARVGAGDAPCRRVGSFIGHCKEPRPESETHNGSGCFNPAAATGAF